MKYTLILVLSSVICLKLAAQPVLETGGKKMPESWIDQDTHHKVVKLSAAMKGNSLSFYFHNNPFVGNEMIFYNSSRQDAAEVTDMKKEETKNENVNNKQVYS